MTEYRLVPVEPTEEMISAVSVVDRGRMDWRKQAVGAYTAMLSAAPPAPTREEVDVDALAQEIRRVDGDHALGAGALAEALAPYILSLLGRQSAGVLRAKEGEG